MIELTEQQVQAIESPVAMPVQVINPRTQETFVLLPIADYKKLKDDEYDDSPWTREELQTLAWEAGKSGGWDETWDEYDDLPEET